MPVKLGGGGIPVTLSGPTPAGATSGSIWRFVPPQTPKPVIWSTDWWTDPEDARALRMLLHAERLGLVDVKAAVISTKLATGPGSLDALATFEGRENLAIGADPTYVSTGTPNWQQTAYDSNFHKEGVRSAVLSSVEVMRRVLAAAADSSVDIIEVGYHTNLQKLLQSTGDAIDSRTGLQLVTAKVRHLWVMGGKYPTASTSENNFGRDATAKTAANYVFANWPSTVPVTLAGFEVGYTVIGGSILKGTEARDPLAQVFVDFGQTGGRSSWDSMLTWMACLDNITAAGYTAVQGTNTVNSSTGVNTFTPGGGGPHRYVVKTEPDEWYADDTDQRLVPGQNPPPGVPPSFGAVKVVAEHRGRLVQPAIWLPPRTTSLNTALQMHLHADDLADLTDGGTVVHWADRMRGYPTRQATSSARPIHRAAIGGLRCVEFQNNQYMGTRDFIPFASGITIYAKVRFSSLPSAIQKIVCADQESVVNNIAYRIFHLGATTGAVVDAATFDPAFGATTDQQSGLVVNTWHVLTLRADASNTEGFVDGVTGGATANAGLVHDLPSRVSLGSRYPDQVGNQFLGYLREVRVYTARHDDTTVANVVAAMA